MSIACFCIAFDTFMSFYAYCGHFLPQLCQFVSPCAHLCSLFAFSPPCFFLFVSFLFMHVLFVTSTLVKNLISNIMNEIFMIHNYRKFELLFRNLSRRSGHCCRFNPLLASVDSLRSLPALQDSPLGYRFLRSPRHCLWQCWNRSFEAA